MSLQGLCIKQTRVGIKKKKKKTQSFRRGVFRVFNGGKLHSMIDCTPMSNHRAKRRVVLLQKCLFWGDFLMRQKKTRRGLVLKETNLD